jgi:ketosteroid isomerase-like protein
MPDGQAIPLRFHEWADLEVTGDLDAWAEFLSEDVELLPPGEPSIRGMEKVREYAAAFFELPISVMKPEEQRVIVSESGDLAVNFGNLRMVLENPEGATELDLKCLAVWRRIGGEWRIVANTWSSNTS